MSLCLLDVEEGSGRNFGLNILSVEELIKPVGCGRN